MEAGLVFEDLATSNGHLVYLIGSIGDSQCPLVRVHLGERKELAHTRGTVHLDGAIDHFERDIGDGHFDARNLARGSTVADSVHEVRGSKDVLTRHVNLDSRFGDPVLDQSLVGETRPDGDSLERSDDHEFERPLRHTE